MWLNALLYEYCDSGAQPRDSDPRRPLTLDIAGNDPRDGPRRGRHARSRYHSRRHGSSLDALSRRDRRVLHDLLLRCQCRHRAQSPMGAHIVPFFRQKKLRCAVPQEEKTSNILELKAYRRSCIASLEAQGHLGKRKLDSSNENTR